MTIEGRRLSYRQAVLSPLWIKPEENGTRIVFGGANVSLWPASNPSHAFINFMDDCGKFPEHLGVRKLTIDLPISQIMAYQGGKLLMERIRLATSPGMYARVFCYGTIVAPDNKPGYKMQIAALDNLVVKVIKLSTSN